MSHHDLPTIASSRTGEGVRSLLPHLEREAHTQLDSIRDQTPTELTEEALVAHAVWELRRTALAEAEKRVVERLHVYSRSGDSFPKDELQKLKDARAECTSAFDALMRALDEVAASNRASSGD